MKLVINGRFLTQPSSGVQNYALGMLKALEKAGVSFEIASPKSDKPGVLNSFLWEQFFLPRYVKSQPGAFLLNFCNSAPISLQQQAVTIHDVAFEHDPGSWFKSSFRVWYKYLIPRICKKAQLVFTVSEFSKTELIRQYQLNEAKIYIIPNGLPEFRFDETFNLPANYIVLTGIENPRKNTDWILENSAVFEKFGLKILLLKQDAGVFGTFTLPNKPSIEVIQNCSPAQYFQILKHAKALIYPSLYEGFGIPVLESLCLGVPVVASNLPVFKESFGALPCYFNNGDVQGLKIALEKALKTTISEKDIQLLKNKYNFETSVSVLLKKIETLQ